MSWAWDSGWHSEPWKDDKYEDQQWQSWKGQWQGKPDNSSQWHDSNNSSQWQGKADKYGSVTTLGLKHPLLLDERKELLLELIQLGTEEGFPRMALFNWDARCVHAAFMILTRAEPGTSLRTLRDDQGVYKKEHAAHVLLESFVALYPSRESRTAVVAKLRANCYDAQDAIIAEAQNLGLDPQQLEDKSLYCPTPRPDSRNGIITAARYAPAPIRELKRNTTDEEIARLEKKQKTVGIAAKCANART